MIMTWTDEEWEKFIDAEKKALDEYERKCATDYEIYESIMEEE